MTAVVIGVSAALFSIASFLPQAYKIWKTRQTKGLSTTMWILNTSAFVLWASYGIALGAWLIIVPNVICGLLAGFILTLELTARRTSSR